MNFLNCTSIYGTCILYRDLLGLDNNNIQDRDPYKNMNEQEIFDKVQSIISEQLGVEKSQVTKDANFANDLGADSLDTVELVMAIEEAFNIEIPDETAEQISNLQQAVDFIRQKVAA